MNFMTSPPATGVTVMRTSGWLVVLTVPPACVAPGEARSSIPIYIPRKGGRFKRVTPLAAVTCPPGINTVADGRFPAAPTFGHSVARHGHHVALSADAGVFLPECLRDPGE